MPWDGESTCRAARRSPVAAAFASYLVALCAAPQDASAAHDTRKSATRPAADPLPGFDRTDHWIPVAYGVMVVPDLDVVLGGMRVGYLFTHWGWGGGAMFGSSRFQPTDIVDHGTEVTLGELKLRRAWLVSEARVWLDGGIGITWIRRGFGQEDADVLLNHGTAGSVEVGVEVGRSWFHRPFLSAKVDAPWFPTERVELRPEVVDGIEVTRIVRSEDWTPVYSFWGGFAF